MRSGLIYTVFSSLISDDFRNVLKQLRARDSSPGRSMMDDDDLEVDPGFWFL